jgi:hypothetical protein
MLPIPQGMHLQVPDLVSQSERLSTRTQTTVWQVLSDKQFATSNVGNDVDTVVRDLRP